jgi:prophage regulatory protein
MGHVKYTEAYEMKNIDATTALTITTNNSARAIRMDEVQNKTGLSKTHIYRLIKKSLFPKPFHLSERAIAFFESDIDNWLNQRRNGVIG